MDQPWWNIARRDGETGNFHCKGYVFDFIVTRLSFDCSFIFRNEISHGFLEIPTKYYFLLGLCIVPTNHTRSQFVGTIHMYDSHHYVC